MLAEVLRTGFVLAHRRPGLLFLDLLWKTLWVILTAIALFVLALWMTSGIRGIEWDDSGIRGVNSLIAAALARQFWNAHAGEIVAAVFTLLFILALVWVVLEAICRRKIVRDLSMRDEQDDQRASTYPLNVFLTSAIVKYTFLAVAAFVTLLVSLAGAATIAIVTFLALAFVLNLLETLIRADAVDLLGTDLIRVAALLGILMSFEGMVAASFVVILVAEFLKVARATDAVIMFGAAVVVVLLLNILHSYLLLVRFSAIAIMRRNVVAI